MLRIIALKFFETGSYNDMTIRPYKTNLDGVSIYAFQETTQGGSQLSPTAMAGVAGQIIRPTSEAMGQAQITNGWDTRRFRFMMAVEKEGYAGTTEIQYLTGYTDEVGVSHGGHLNPNMRLYFNNSIVTRRTLMQTAMGNQYVQGVREASQIILGGYQPQYNGFNMSMNNVQATMRPFDVFASLQSSQGDPSGMTSMYDLRSSFAEGFKKSSYKNNAAPSYLSNVMTTLNDAFATAEGSEDLQGIYTKAVDSQRSEMLANDPFLSTAARNTSLMEGGSITYQELCTLSPGLDQIVDVHTYDTIHRSNAHQRGHTEHWHGSNNETVFATILSHSIPSVMMDLMITRCHITATNRTLDGSLDLRVSGTQTFVEGLDMSPYLQSLLSRLRHEVFRDLTMNNSIDLYVDCDINLVAESKINISVSGGPMTPFCVPSFCDGAFSPVLTNSMDSLLYLSHDLEQLSSNASVQQLAPSYQSVYTGDTPQPTNAAPPTGGFQFPGNFNV